MSAAEMPPVMIPDFDEGLDPEASRIVAELSMVMHAAQCAINALSRGDPLSRVADYIADATKWSKIASDSCHTDNEAQVFARKLTKSA